MIEKLPFFVGHLDKGKAIVDVAVFERWIRENPIFETLTDEDERDRTEAREELTAGDALDLKKAMESWQRTPTGS